MLYIFLLLKLFAVMKETKKQKQTKQKIEPNDF